jgi:hypothetical protein
VVRRRLIARAAGNADLDASAQSARSARARSEGCERKRVEYGRVVDPGLLGDPGAVLPDLTVHPPNCLGGVGLVCSLDPQIRSQPC